MNLSELSNNMNKVLSACLLLFIFSFRADGQVMKGAHHVGIKGPHVIIYKTRANYDSLVPVTLSADKQKVVSYPDPKDVYSGGELAYPWLLKKRYRLDNRGISENSAFIKLSYSEYSKLANVPPVADLLNMIVDKDPITEMYDLGPRSQYKNVVKEVNEIIERGELGKYTKVK